ncbi:hypothetical protein BSKO_12670 [Bryopsis sp. KO-2023]|nr:hypothetical protein BSKO_12670 [Bryopsis sp. KO-2023]
MSNYVNAIWDLPGDIVGQILNQLRPKSIVTCMLVSKTWRDVVKRQPGLQGKIKLEAAWRCRNLDPIVHYPAESFYTWSCARSNNRVALAGPDGVLVLDLRNGDILFDLRGWAGATRSLCFLDELLASGGCSGELRGWEVSSGDQVFCVGAFSCYVSSIADLGDYVALGGWDGRLETWKKESWSRFGNLKGHTDYIDCLSSAKEGALLVSGSGDSTIRVWDVLESACVNVLSGNSHGASCLEVFDGFIVCGLWDGLIFLWRLESGALWGVFEGHVNGIAAISFDGVRIVSGSHDGVIKVWDLMEQGCIRTFVTGDCCERNGIWVDGDELVVVAQSGRMLVWNFLRDLE